MNSGQTFALAGLLNQTTSAQAQSTPGLGNVPVLGSLFRSVRYQEQDTELVVLATVSLVEPLSIVDERPLPGDLHAPPSDWELYANGSIEGRVPAKTSEAHAAWLHERGLDELRGPGAWQSYMTPPGTPMPAASAPAAKESEAPAEAPAQAEAPAETAEKPAESGEAPAVEETK
jgi:pilus assembly protein CpaC